MFESHDMRTNMLACHIFNATLSLSAFDILKLMQDPRPNYKENFKAFIKEKKQEIRKRTKDLEEQRCECDFSVRNSTDCFRCLALSHERQSLFDYLNAEQEVNK